MANSESGSGSSGQSNSYAASQTLLTAFQARLEGVASHHRFSLSKQYRWLEHNSEAADFEQTLQQFQQKLEGSLAIVEQRQAAIPEITFPEQLPISEKREDIAAAIQQNQVVVIAGETGSGKTTQLPKICLSIGRGVKGLIGHTQPRRIAARSVASRIAEELNTRLGDIVGYQVRFTDQASSSTAVKLMTDGILLAEIQRDRFLSRYDTIIIDEAHERSLNIDFLMGFLKQLLPKRPDLKVIITSATIDVEKFSEHFDQAPIIEVSGRTYPVDILYRPLLEMGSDSVVDGIINAIQEISAIDHQGDILVFLSGERDIRETALKLRREQIPHLSVVPLYARLSIAEQNKIFQTHRGQRIVLATNVAETSLTVPGIRYVIDPGYARISCYSFRTKVQRLPIEAVSQASANQRKGRCGRVSEGICIRLYSEEDFNSRPEFTDPEILRTNLAAVILQMAQLKLGDVRRFPFVDAPDHRLINDGYKLLQELQAVPQSGHTPNNKLTKIGRLLTQLPVDPRFGRMLLAADQLGCLQEVVVIVSALSIQDPRERPADKQQAADQKHREYWHEKSDFLAYWQLWQIFEEQRQELSGNQLQKWCQKNYLAYNRMREWRDIHTQLSMAAKSISLTWNSEPAAYAAIHTALVTGLLGNIGNYSKEKTRDYIGARNRRFQIFPGSSQFKKAPQWILTAELLETSKLYAHTVASVETDWILSVAQHQVKRQHVEPHYSPRSGQVMAYEKISLYGLVLVEKKAVAYSPINPSESREIFIRAALVEGQYGDHKRIKNLLRRQSPDTHFFCWQQDVLQALHDLEAKSRRRDILADDQVLYDFYDRLMPGDAFNLDSFEQWRKTVETKEPRLLFIDRERLMQHDADHITASQFPDSVEMNGIHIPVVYHFDPSHRDDGVTLKVPVSTLHLLSAERLQWLVPGLLGEKITAMIKGLPKQWRKQFAPVPATVSKLLPKVSPLDKSLAEVVGEQLYRLTGVKVPDDCWQAMTLDLYYQFNIHVLDESGQLLDQGRDLPVLRERYRDHVQNHLQTAGNDYEQSGLTDWSFGELAETHTLPQQGLQIRVYPGLNDKGDSVDLTLFDNPDEAVVNSVKGMVRLAMLSQAQTIKYLRKQLLKNRDIGLSVVTMGSREQVVDDILCATIRQTCFDNVLEKYPLQKGKLIRDQKAFLERVEQCKSQWVERAERIEQLLWTALNRVVDIKKQLKQGKNGLLLVYAMPDINQQLCELFYVNCLYDTPIHWLEQYSRYLKAILVRLEKIPMNVQKDRVSIAELDGLQERYQTKRTKEGHIAWTLNNELQTYRWMLEELRVSLFAQTLGTSMPVSVKRLNKQWEQC